MSCKSDRFHEKLLKVNGALIEIGAPEIRIYCYLKQAMTPRDSDLYIRYFDLKDNRSLQELISDHNFMYDSNKDDFLKFTSSY